MKVLIAGFKHETNTFAPDLAPWSAFEAGEIFPPAVRGEPMLAMLDKVPVPGMGFLRFAREQGWEAVPSLWCGAVPSSYVTAEAFEKICAEICADVKSKQFEAIYLDLHGAAMAEGVDDAEGELLARVRALAGDDIPIVASLDLHANVTHQMLACADALLSFRTYPHIDYVETGALAAEALRRRLLHGRRETIHCARLPFLIPVNSQNTTFGKPKAIYDRLAQIDVELGTLSNFCMGFPSSDFAECAPMIWSIGERAQEAVAQLEAMASEPTQWRLNVYTAQDAVKEAIRRSEATDKPVVIADTQDNPGIGGTGSTTGMLHALLEARAGAVFPQRVAVAVMNDPAFAAQAIAAGVGARFRGRLGQPSMLWDGPSDPPVEGAFTVKAVSDGRVTYKGPKMTGFLAELGPSACVEIDGVLVVVASAKIGAQDRELFRFVGVHPEQMKIMVVKSSNHFRADFAPLVENERTDILTAKARGAMAVDPGDLPWQKLPETIRRRP
ncbi:Microcystinase C [Paraburkholderia unamae]|uniref:M81 family metallopeptidase n=1 Tax=Paraburkholderia unamae TaxID=219649 RepID=UPI001CB3D4B0|nr:M81 family metallopeptidase [Paraburkholderia unamae]CAG9257429.1 Microcystinase C [Paraburkholderia unamae]